MKTKVFFAICMLAAAFTTGQERVLEEIEVIPPQFRHHECRSIQDYLQKNLEFPTQEMNYNFQGTVVIQFIVHPNSKISDFEVINNVSRRADNEVIRVLNSTNGLWNPGYADNKAVPMKKEVSVVFYIDSFDDIYRLAQHHNEKANEWLFDKNNPQRALKHYNMAIKYLPYEQSLWTARLICREKLGDAKGIAKDKVRLNELAEIAKEPDNETVAILGK